MEDNITMVSKECLLNAIMPGEYISWFATTQAGYSIRAKLYDDKKVYFDQTRQSNNPEPAMAQGFAQYVGKNLKLYLDIPQSGNIRVFQNYFPLTNPDNGAEIGHSMTFCIEDYTDNDYNDFCLNVIGWKFMG